MDPNVVIQNFSGILKQILDNNNETRKAAELALSNAKREDANNYALVMVQVMNPAYHLATDVQSLAAVILRRNISTQAIDTGDVKDAANNANLWLRLSDQHREMVKKQLLEVLANSIAGGKNLTHKICSLAVEIQGAMYEHENNTIWQDLITLVYSLISTSEEAKVDAGLQILNGLFSYIMEHMIKFKTELMQILQTTLQHSSLDIKLAALQATSNLLSTCERADSKAFVGLIPAMTKVIMDALAADDETVLEDALVEFNELAEIEPAFFKPVFTQIWTHLKGIISYKDFANTSIRQQPLEFVVTLIERLPSIVKKDEALLKDILEQIFLLMIDIDPDIEQSWLCPKEGFQQDGDEEEDHVAFGKNCVDRLVSSIGDAIMLPLIGTLVVNTVQNDSDWRYKHAGIMAFSQVGEYVDDPQKIAMMVPVIVQHCQHPNPKIRYASLHAIGQIADDMPEEFQKTYFATVLPMLIDCLNDQVPRVQSHACAALTNFMEGFTEQISTEQLQLISQKLLLLVQNGISLVKENASTALASTVESVKEAYAPFFVETLHILIDQLNKFNSIEYKQFRGQVIEAITIICAGVGEENFKPVAPEVIKVMLTIQTTQLEKKDAQRIYLLSAWQRICLLMKSDFGPYLEHVLPSIFSMATLNPEMGISGQESIASLTDVLNEIRPEEDGEKKLNVVTDEIEEKDVAIQMLSVFIDELGGAFFQFIEPAARVLLNLTTYTANDSIRQTCVSALPGLLKCHKTVRGCVDAELHTMANMFQDNIFKAMKEETETDVLISQVAAVREIILEMGTGFLNQDSVTFIGERAITIIDKSLGRIKELEEIKQEEAEDEDEQLDQEDLALLKEEGNNEYDLQLAAAELIGALFKTQPMMVSNIVHELRTKTLQDAFGSQIQKRMKFGLFILDDMIEHLGPTYFSFEDYSTIVQTIASFAKNKSASLRQAAAYGIGIIAQYGGDAFVNYSQGCLEALKGAVEYQMSGKVNEKKNKSTQFYHARDNAIASIGKILKFQKKLIQQDQNLYSQLTQYWVNLLPITHDTEEAQVQYEFLAEYILQEPTVIFSGGQESIKQVAKVLGEAFQEKYFSEKNKQLLADSVRWLMATPDTAEVFQGYVQSALTEDHRKNIEQAYYFQQK